MSNKALIAMSGGVDSSVAAFLLKQQGYDCTGVTMKLYDGSDGDADDARKVAEKLGIAHHELDLSKDFKEHVIDPFIKSYQNGITPNPCVLCNRRIKFGQLFEFAKELGADVIATGHYARVEKDAATGRYLLKKAVDISKDQSYVLYSLSGEQLGSVMLPLGSLKKSDIRAIAAQQGFVNAGKRESQDICFVPDGDYAGFIERCTGTLSESGDFIDTQGNVLGSHKGLIRYTVGQRKGLGLALPKPMYVKSKDVKNNTVVLCYSDELCSRELDAVDFNWIMHDRCPEGLRVKAKTRYSSTEQPATVTTRADGSVHIVFDEPQRAITPGQSVVLYDGDVVIGGGVITQSPPLPLSADPV